MSHLFVILGIISVPFFSFFHTPSMNPTPAEPKTQRTVVFIRHAKSSWDYPELTDFNRPLNDRGNRDAPFMGEKLKGIDFDLIISSPSKRTKLTMQHICDQIDYSFDQIVWDETVYHSTQTNLLRILQSLDDTIQTVAIVGHNPSMTQISNALQSDTVLENVPTTGVVSISFDANHWTEIQPSKGHLNFFIYPKKYQRSVEK